MRWGAASAQPRWIVGTARPAVAYLRLYLAGGGTARVRVTEVSGLKFYAMQIGSSTRCRSGPGRALSGGERSMPSATGFTGDAGAGFGPGILTGQGGQTSAR